MALQRTVAASERTSPLGRFDPFASSSSNGRCFREADNRSRRILLKNSDFLIDHDLRGH